MITESEVNKKAKAGIEQLQGGFNSWTKGVGKYSTETIYGILGANWAVRSKPNEILADPWAMWSVGFCVIFLIVNLLVVYTMSEILERRIEWAKEHKHAFFAERHNLAWPWTDCIEWVPGFRRLLCFLLPLMAAVCFLVSLIQ